MKKSVLLFAATILLVLPGCRMYGGHGSEEATLVEIGKAVESIKSMLEDAERDGGMLETAASGNARLEPLARLFSAIVDDNRHAAEHGEELLHSLESETGTYRQLSRALGSLVTEKSRLANSYQSVIRKIAVVNNSRIPSTTVGRIGADARYRASPPAYNRIGQNAVTMREALGAR